MWEKIQHYSWKNWQTNKVIRSSWSMLALDSNVEYQTELIYWRHFLCKHWNNFFQTSCKVWSRVFYLLLKSTNRIWLDFPLHHTFGMLAGEPINVNSMASAPLLIFGTRDLLRSGSYSSLMISQKKYHHGRPGQRCSASQTSPLQGWTYIPQHIQLSKFTSITYNCFRSEAACMFRFIWLYN